MGRWIGRKRRNSDLDDEIAAHLAMAARDLGSRSAARRDFGSEALVKEVTRAIWSLGWLERLGYLSHKSYGDYFALSDRGWEWLRCRCPDSVGTLLHRDGVLEVANIKQYRGRFRVLVAERYRVVGMDLGRLEVDRRSLGEGKALAAVWPGAPGDLNWPRAVLLGWLNDVRRDLWFCARTRRLREWPHAMRIRCIAIISRR